MKTRATRARTALIATTDATIAATFVAFSLGAGEGEWDGVEVEEGEEEADEEEGVSIRTQLVLPLFVTLKACGTPVDCPSPLCTTAWTCDPGANGKLILALLAFVCGNKT